MLPKCAKGWSCKIRKSLALCCFFSFSPSVQNALPISRFPSSLLQHLAANPRISRLLRCSPPRPLCMERVPQREGSPINPAALSGLVCLHLCAPGLVNFANDSTFLMIDVLVFLGRCFLLQGIRPLVTGLTRNRRKGELEGALKGSLLYPLPQGRINYSYIISDRYLSVLFLKASSDGDPTASPGCRRALIVLIIPKFFLPSSQNLPCCTLSPLFLVLSPADTKNRLFPSSAAALSVFEDFSITSSLVSSRSDQTNPGVTSVPAASPPSKTQR